MTNEMVYCHACGKQMHSSARMCPSCGAVPKGMSFNANATVNGLQDAVKVCFTKYATFSGRATRSEFWYFQLFLLLVNIALNIMSLVSPGFFMVISVLWGFGVMIPALAVAVRRLHDVGKSGWYVLLSFAGSVLMGIAFSMWVGAALSDSGGGGLGFFGFVMFMAGIGLFVWQIVLYCTRGTPGPNQYGEPASA